MDGWREEVMKVLSSSSGGGGEESSSESESERALFKLYLKPKAARHRLRRAVSEQQEHKERYPSFPLHPSSQVSWIEAGFGYETAEDQARPALHSSGQREASSLAETESGAGLLSRRHHQGRLLFTAENRMIGAGGNRRPSALFRSTIFRAKRGP